MNIILYREKSGCKETCEAIAELCGEKWIADTKYNGESNVFRWGCTSHIPDEEIGVYCTYNHKEAIHLAHDKKAFRGLMMEQEKILCPITIGYDELDLFDIDKLIVRPRFHSKGRKVYLCKNRLELYKAENKCKNDYYISEYIEKLYEYRIYCADNRVLAVARKIPHDYNAVAWNVHQGSKMIHTNWKDWPTQSCIYALKVHKLSGLDFSAVDVMEDENRSYVLEINTAPKIDSPYRQQCYAKVFQYMVDNELLPEKNYEKIKTYKGVIHPSISHNLPQKEV